jgi:hypothetical protein
MGRQHISPDFAAVKNANDCSETLKQHELADAGSQLSIGRGAALSILK